MPNRSSGQAPATEFEIWQAGGRLLSIESVVRLKILRHLEQGPRTLNELVAATRKSKPTLSSLHMPPLLKFGLVTEAPDPRDSRVKWYSLKGRRVGSSSSDPQDLKEVVQDAAQSRGLVPLRTVLEALDLNALLAHPDARYVDGVAQRLGKMIGRMLKEQEPTARAKEIARILEQERQGTLEWHQGVVRVKPAREEAAEFWRRVVSVALGERATR